MTNLLSTRNNLGCIALCAVLLTAFGAQADPLARPGDLQLRHDIQLLADEGVINIPVTMWPIPWDDIDAALDAVSEAGFSSEAAQAISRLRLRARYELGDGGLRPRAWASVAAEPRVIRNFEDTPREEAQAGLEFGWAGRRFIGNVSATYAHDPVDGDEFRPDDTYLGMYLGNWIVSAGWQQRWWGPGNEGSIILSTNARPTPGIALQRNLSTPFKTKWLSWLGPWSLTTFMQQLDDERVVNDGLMWGFRFSFRPLRSLEISLSRTAQWCGDDRPCNGGTFWDLLTGNDNRGLNVGFEDEPGDQLGGFDVRWSLPKQIPVALYLQWIGEDRRTEGGPMIFGSFSRQFGAEFWGTMGELAHRTHIEVSEIGCRKGEFGFAEFIPDCGYEHSIYETGYRYEGRSMGHGIDGDSRSYSLGSTLVEPAGHTWNVTVRFMEINFENDPTKPIQFHSLTATPQDRADVQVSHVRETRFGRFHMGLGYSYLDDEATGVDTSDVTAFLQWSTRITELE